MAEGIPTVFAVDLTRKWRALAERRRAHLVDLYDSGRWRLYYSEQEFVLRLREAIGVVEKWSATERSATCEAAALSVGPIKAVNSTNGAADEAVNGVDFGGTDDALASASPVADSLRFDEAGDETSSVGDSVCEKVPA